MSARGRAAAILAALMVTMPKVAGAQKEDSVPPVRHILALDYTRVRPFQRSYDIVVTTRDSVAPIGRRSVSLAEATIADSTSGWILVETRSGVVASVDSVLLAPDLRPLRWRSTLGGATLDMAFSSDSMIGTVRIGAAASHVARVVPPDLLLSSTGLEMIAALLPLAPGWADSTNALSMDLAGARVDVAELSVTGEDSVVVTPGSAPRRSWVLLLRSGARESRFWIDRETLDVLRAQQKLPSHVGAVLEYRIRPAQSTTAP